MTDDGVGAASYQSTIRSCEPKGASKSQERRHANGQTNQLEDKPCVKPPMRMSSDWSEQHTAECAAECKEPVIQPPARSACGAPNEVGDHHPHLFDEERYPDQTVRRQIRLQCCLCKERRAGSSDEICTDPDNPLCTA